MSAAVTEAGRGLGLGMPKPGAFWWRWLLLSAIKHGCEVAVRCFAAMCQVGLRPHYSHGELSTENVSGSHFVTVRNTELQMCFRSQLEENETTNVMSLKLNYISSRLPQPSAWTNNTKRR